MEPFFEQNDMRVSGRRMLIFLAFFVPAFFFGIRCFLRYDPVPFPSSFVYLCAAVPVIFAVGCNLLFLRSHHTVRWITTDSRVIYESPLAVLGSTFDIPASELASVSGIGNSNFACCTTVSGVKYKFYYKPRGGRAFYKHLDRYIQNKSNKPAHPTGVTSFFELSLPFPPWMAYSFGKKSKTMKTLLILIALTVTTLSANAGQIIPPPMLIKSWALTMSRRSSTYSPELSSIDYAKIVKQNPTWTKEAVKELFASIDSEKIKFLEHDSLDKVIVMVEPVNVRYTFEVNQSPASPAVKYGVTTFYSLVGIERIHEKEAQQDGIGQPATRSEAKLEGSDKPQPEAEGRSR